MPVRLHRTVPLFRCYEREPGSLLAKVTEVPSQILTVSKSNNFVTLFLRRVGASLRTSQKAWRLARRYCHVSPGLLPGLHGQWSRFRRLSIERINKEKSERKRSKRKGTYEKYSQFSCHHRTYRVVTLIKSNFWQRERESWYGSREQ